MAAALLGKMAVLRDTYFVPVAAMGVSHSLVVNEYALLRKANTSLDCQAEYQTLRHLDDP